MNVLDITHRLAPATSWRDAGDHEHFVQFYEQESELLQSVSEYIQHGLHAGAAALVIATAPHLEELERGLRTRGVDVAAATARQQLVLLEASAVLARIMHHGAPQWGRFLEVLGSVIAGLRRRHSRVIAFGEMVSLLLSEGRQESAVQLEQLWNELARRERFSLYCAYPLPREGEAADYSAFERICSQHGRIIPAESYIKAAPEA